MKTKDLLNPIDNTLHIPSAEGMSTALNDPVGYSSQANIFFTRSVDSLFIDLPLIEPKILNINEQALQIYQVQTREPIIDILPESERLPFLSSKEIHSLYTPKPLDTLNSILLHSLLILVYAGSYLLGKPSLQQPQITEISFGLVDAPSQTVPENNNETTQGQTEATKTAQELPQLPKNVVPDTAPLIKKEAEQNKDTTKTKDLVLKEETQKITSPKKQIEKQEEKKEPKKVEGPKPKENEQKIKPDDFMKRLELDTRKVDKTKAAGVHDKNKQLPNGKVDNTAIPKSPFASSSDIPENPLSKSPAGDLHGKVSQSAYDQYRAYLSRQLKLNWNTTEGTSYAPNLKTKVQFVVNSFGYLVGTPKILSSSGDQNFDNAVLSALKNTFPVTTTPPKNINPPSLFEATYSAKDIQN